ncbi:MAG TPA: CAP domain-containing protein [Pyrinomonadaceae bacterium]|nr:CAP domain-containing protein [Pyrinomonadaceae bacterium]
MSFPRSSPFRFAAALLLLALTAQLALPQGAARPSTAGGRTDFKALEEKVLEEINLARTAPVQYAEHLERLRPHYSGKEFRQPGRPTLITEEGVAALDEAVKFLRAAKPLPPLQPSRGLSSGALLLVSEQSTSGTTGHRGADGGFMEQRVARYGSWKGPVGENLSYGEETARERVISMLIDDGVSNRGHRNRIFNPSYTVAGIACGAHQLGGVCAVTLAAGFTDGSGAGGPQPSGKNVALPSGARKF